MLTRVVTSILGTVLGLYAIYVVFSRVAMLFPWLILLGITLYLIGLLIIVFRHSVAQRHYGESDQVLGLEDDKRDSLLESLIKGAISPIMIVYYAIGWYEGKNWA